MNKFTRWMIAMGGIIMTLCIASNLHRGDLSSGGILNDTTQIMFLNSGKGLLCYLLIFVSLCLSAVGSRRVKGDILSSVLSWLFTTGRTIAALAVISAGTSIYVFEGKFLQIMQLLFVIIAFALQFIIPSREQSASN